MADMFTNLLTSQQAATQDYYGGRQGVANAAQIGAQTQNSQAQQSLAGQRGAYEQQAIQQGIQGERDYGIAQQHQEAENAAFGLDKYKAKQDAVNDRANVRLRRRQQRQSQRDKDEDQSLAKQKFRNDKEKDAYQKAHGLGPYKKPSASGGGKQFTPAQHHEAKVSLRKAIQLVKGELGPNTGSESREGPHPSSPAFWEKAYAALVNKKDMDPAIARAAIQILRHGKVKPNIAKILASDYGILHPPTRKRSKPKAAYRPSSGVNVAPGANGQLRPN